MNSPTRAMAWRWILAALVPFYLALTLASAAARVWPADKPPFFHDQFLFLAEWLPGVGLWARVIDLRATFLDGRFQLFMPILIVLVACWAYMARRIRAMLAVLGAGRRLEREKKRRDRMRLRIPSK